MSERSSERTRSRSDESVRDRTADRLDSLTGMDRPGRTSEKTDRVMRYGTYALVSLAVALLVSFAGGIIGAIPVVGGVVAGLLGLVGLVAWLAFFVFAVLFAYPLVKAMMS